MDKFELQKLRDLPIEGVAEQLGLQVKRHLCLCPFHNDHHASLSFNLRKNTFRCFVCGASGNTIDLVMRCLNKAFREACEWLAGELVSGFKFQDSGFMVQGSRVQSSRVQEKAFDAQKYEKFFERPWLSPKAKQFLFDERRLDSRVVAWCRLTSWRDKQGVNWLQIPYYDSEGRLVGIQNRNLDWVKVQGSKVQEVQGVQGVNSPLSTDSKLSTLNSQLSEAPRFRFPQGSQCGIYNLPVLNRLREGEELWITEGASDCWAMLSSGHKAIAIPSATLLKPKDLNQLSIINCQLSIKFHMFPDRDEPGERLFLQLKELLPKLVHHQLPPGCKDYSDYYLQVKSEKL